MNGWRLFRWVLWRGIAISIILGAVFGSAITSIDALQGAVGICFISFFAGAILGGVLGGILGAIDGLALVVLTHFFSPLVGVRPYRWSALLIALICTAVSSLLTVHLLFGDLPFVLIPVTIIATITAGCIAWRLPTSAQPTDGHRPPANAVLFYIEK